MGCCASTPSNDPRTSPYTPSNTHGDSSSHAITSAAPHESEEPSPLNTSRTPRTTQQHRSRRRIRLNEQFNEPLRPHPWTSEKRYTRRELTRLRNEFFDTRVTGREEIWASLRAVVELVVAGDIPTAQGILDAAGITVPTGDLHNGAYDETGNHYQIPEPIVNDPGNVVIDAQDEISKSEDSDEVTDEVTDEDELERRREEKGKGVVIKSEDMLRVKVRLSDRANPDIVVSVGKDQNVRTLIRRVKEKADVPPEGKVKIAYLGKLFDNDRERQTLEALGWKEGHVLNAYIS